MKLKQLAVACGLAAAMMLSAGTIYAQDNAGGGGNGGGGGGNGGGGGRGRGGFGDPAQFQQMLMDGARTRLGFTNDTDWEAVQPWFKKFLMPSVPLVSPIPCA